MIRENLEKIRKQIEISAGRAGKRPEDIILLGATKTVEPEKINEAIDFGLRVIGENTIQEAERKFKNLNPAEKHFIGHLQRNKVKKAIQLFDMIESVDSLKLARKIRDECLKNKKTMPVLIQVLTDPKKQYGIPLDRVKDFLSEISEFKGIKVEGLFTVGPYFKDPEKIRPVYRKMKKLFEDIKEEKIPGVDMLFLSMGMSMDYQTAIEEGANIVRIGTALFGERKT